MKVRLIDIDSTIPNLALMQISGYHKDQGDTVELINYSRIAAIEKNSTLEMYEDIPDIVYISCIFTKNKALALDIFRKTEAKEIKIGGSGINYDKLSIDMDIYFPDYSLYDGQVCQRCGHKLNYCKCKDRCEPGNIFYSLGFTTRGCIRNCEFCIVREKEGHFYKYQPISEFHHKDHDVVICLDNNIYADEDWFNENMNYILKNKLKFNAIQGMDIRILTPDIAHTLAKIKWHGQLHFAFDNMSDEKWVRRGIEILLDAGIKIRHNVQFYVLVGYNTTEEEDKYRCRLLKKLGTNPYVMPYIKNEWTNKIARWANYKKAFWSTDIDDYDQVIARQLGRERRARLPSGQIQF